MPEPGPGVPRRAFGRTARRFLPLLVGSVSATGCGGSVASKSPEATVRAFLGAVERQDAEAALALLAEDFVFRNAAGSFEVDRDGIAPILAWDATARSEPRIERLRASGDTVRARLVERNRFSELLDLEPWVVDAEFVVRDGRIQRETVREVTGEGPSFTERFHAALDPVRRWALEARPGEAEDVFEDGRVTRYDGPTARRLLRLIVGYRRATGAGR